MGEASVSATRDHPFVLDEPTVKKLFDLLKERIGAAKISINCRDGITREYSNYKNFRDYENAKTKEIVELSIRAHEQLAKSATVRFGASKYRLITVDMEGSEVVVTRLNSEVLDILDGIRPWYSRVARLDLSDVFFGFVLFGVLVITLYTPESDKPRPTVELLTAVQGTLILFAIMAAIYVVYKILQGLQEKYFPMACFSIGQGVERYRIAEKIRWSVIVATSLSIISTVAVGLL